MVTGVGVGAGVEVEVGVGVGLIMPGGPYPGNEATGDSRDFPSS
jgi:hypothetical protein